MFAVGDNVLYGADGVCTITEHGLRDFFGSTREYYILKPNADPSGTVYVPADNPALVEKMRRLMTKEEIDGILAECAGADNGNGTSPDCESPDWIADDGERKHTYDEILQSGDRQQIFRMIRALYIHREIIRHTLRENGEITTARCTKMGTQHGDAPTGYPFFMEKVNVAGGDAYPIGLHIIPTGCRNT